MTHDEHASPPSASRQVGPPLPTSVTAEWPDWSQSNRLPALDQAEPMLPLSLLPTRKRRSNLPLLASFFVFVLVPTAAAGYYYYKVASDQYVSEFRFSISQVSSAIPGTPPSTSTSSSASSSLMAGISAITGGASVSSGGGQNYVVTDYIKSDQAVRDLSEEFNLRAMFDKANIDKWDRLPDHASFEELADYWRKMVTADYDPVTNIAWANVRAFDPQDAYKLATKLVSLSERLVNSVEERASKDVVAAAEREVQRTQLSLVRARLALRLFRDAEGTIDPTQSIVPTNTQQISSVEATIIQLNTKLASTMLISANNPALKGIQAQIRAARAELARLRDEVSKRRGGNKVLSDVIGRFEASNFDIQYQQAMAMSAMQSREQAYANANGQHLFMTPYVKPMIPTTSTYPKRLSSTLYAGLAFVGIWIVLLLLKRSLHERG